MAPDASNGSAHPPVGAAPATWNPILQPILPGWTPPPVIPIADGLPMAAKEDVIEQPLPPDFAPRDDPIVIDNGSAELRAGFASQARAAAERDSWTSLRPPLAVDNVVSKYKDRKRGISLLLAGRDAFIDTPSRSSVRSPFERDVVVSFDVMENMLDYTFLKLGVASEGGIQHPIAMTETLCNPSFSRGQMMELLIETYDAPSVAFGLDSLFAAHANGIREGLIVSSGRSSTTVVPLIDGRGVLANSKRLNWGGLQASEYLLRLCQLKYPAFPTRVTASQATFMLHNLAYVCDGQEESYLEHVKRLSKPDELAKEDRIVQFPFSVETTQEKTAEELEAIAEKRRESGRRLQEQTQRIRLEKMMQKENDLQYYAQLKEWKAKERRGEYLKRLEGEGFDSEQDLENTIRKIEASLKRSRARDLGEDPDADAEPPTFPLIDVPDHQLDEEGVKEKRRQRLLKAGYDARMRAKAEKMEEKRQRDEERRRDEEERRDDPKGWARRMRKEYETAIGKIKERKRLREMLSDRKSLAAQQRMKSITTLASDQPEGKRKRSRKSGAGGQDDDNFGADDADWAVYRDIHGADDSEEEEEEQTALEALERRLLEHDPSFSQADTYAFKQASQSRLTSAFLRGYWPHWDAASAEQAHQVHLNVERCRVAEVLWQPSMAGVDQAGVDEIAALVLLNYEGEMRRRLANNVFVTGQHTRYANFDARLRGSLQSTQPSDVRVRVVRARDVRFDAWRGMAAWCLPSSSSSSPWSEEYEAARVTRQEYAEKGAEYLKEHRYGASMV